MFQCESVPRTETGFLDRSARGMPYVVYVPRGWTAATSWPVILLLHGAGERGTDGHRQTQIGAAAAIRSMPEEIPAVVVFPQAPEDACWIGEPAEMAMDALRQAAAEFHGDAFRTYLTGLSLGGFGTWHLALAHPRTFAALVPVCGGIVPHGSATSVRQSPLTKAVGDPYAFVAAQLRDTPAWLFHGADDTVILPSESRQMFAALRAAGADVRYTEYKGVAHNSWERAYAEKEMWRWLFRQRLPATSAPDRPAPAPPPPPAR